MLKKVLSVMFLAALLVVGSSQLNTASAARVYVGSYSDGSEAYLLTESVRIQSRSPYTFTCTINYDYSYLDYSFYPVQGSPYYRNSEGYQGYVFGGQSPVASNIYRYVVNNW